jgi:hypothetical protein
MIKAVNYWCLVFFYILLTPCVNDVKYLLTFGMPVAYQVCRVDVQHTYQQGQYVHVV